MTSTSTSHSQPIGISTSWTGPQSDPQRLLDMVRSLGFRRIEAYAHFTPSQLNALAAAARAQGVEIASLHGPCPVAVNAGGTPTAWGDWLASTSADERGRAVDQHKRTIDAALEVGARAIVVHLGNSGTLSHQRALFDTIAQYGQGSEQHVRLRDTAARERAAARGPHLEAALQSIRALGEHAAGTDVRLGVECRDGYWEIPSLDEVADVLAACQGLPVGYWHDAGHGAKLEYLGFLEHEEYLRRYGDRLVGMHIHDTRAGRDHQAPGQGDTDFAMLARYLRPDTIRSLELHASATPTQIAQALDLLEPMIAFGVREGILVEL
jgi:sugar phosphate isomerase/epimerase